MFDLRSLTKGDNESSDDHESHHGHAESGTVLFLFAAAAVGGVSRVCVYTKMEGCNLITIG